MSFHDRGLKFADALANKYALSVIVIIFSGLLLSNLSADPDLFARLAVGRLIVELGYLPHADPFAFSPKKEIWVDHEWLSGLVFYLIYAGFSDIGLFVFKILAMTATFCFLFSAQKLLYRQRDFSIFVFSLIVLLDSLYAWASTVRSQIFTYLFLSFYLYAFTRFKALKDMRLFLAAPVCMLIWANAHGGFVVGLGLHLIFIVFAVREKLFFHWSLFILSVAATAINPYGFLIYWNYIIHAVSMSRPTISEWHALNFFDSSAVLTWLLISLSAFSLFRKGRELFVYVFYFTALYFALRHVRHVAIFNFIIIVFLPDSLNLLKEFFNKRNLFFEKVKVSASIVAAGFASYFLIILFAFIINTRSFKLDVFRYPEKALQWLAENRTGGNLLVDFNNGSYALWKLYPRFLVSLDGRYEELYPESTMNLVSGALNCRSESRKEALEILEPDYILAPMREDCFAVEYRTLYSDDKYFLYGKR